mmetsp:Transcript_24581/g.68530  ORF Transcript_24581/g.68530 Transcript_24581/m.68530 type:complete len:94 (-) Transcript_24581:826-1107(-)
MCGGEGNADGDTPMNMRLMTSLLIGTWGESTTEQVVEEGQCHPQACPREMLTATLECDAVGSNTQAPLLNMKTDGVESSNHSRNRAVWHTNTS